MEINELFDIPAHPLLVHAPVVFVPLLFLISIAVAARPSWRRHAPWLAIALFFTAIATFLAKGSGEKLEARLQLGKAIQQHADLGEMTAILVFLQFLAAAVLAFFVWKGKAVESSLRKLIMPMAVVTVILGGLSTLWMVRTGHEGARVTWEQTPEAP